jgi:predicted regulator of Ras-like GTPase activity (Roadblock/LC7/MglB family)
MASSVASIGPSVASTFKNAERLLNGFVAIGLADAQGLPIAFLGPSVEKDAATAMSTLVVSAAARAAKFLGLPSVREVTIDATGFTMLVRPIGDRFTLLAILDSDTNIGYAKLVLQTCSDDIRIALEST